MRNQVVFFVLSLFWTCALSDTCTTPLGAISTCMSLYDCQQLVTAFDERPLKSNVVSFLRQSQCGFQGYVPMVCCGPLPSQQEHPPTTQRTTTTRRSTYVGGDTDPVYDEDSSPAPRNDCGVSNDDKIFGGQFTDLDEFPWMALIGYLTRTRSTTYQCGGVLVNRRYVLTAAHCLIGAVLTEVGTPTKVRLGEYDTQNEVDCINDVCADPTQDIPILSSYAHPGYNDRNKNKRDDIGLIRLAKRATFTYYVKPICLVNNNERLIAGHDVVVAGWGKTLNGRNSPVKLKLKLPVFNKEECAEKYRGLGAELIDGQICAGGVFSQDACRGDSGGPLMKRRPEGIWETVAVVSFGYGCGRDGWPGVYTSVASYSDWIRSTMRSTNV